MRSGRRGVSARGWWERIQSAPRASASSTTSGSGSRQTARWVASSRSEATCSPDLSHGAARLRGAVRSICANSAACRMVNLGSGAYNLRRLGPGKTGGTVPRHRGVPPAKSPYKTGNDAQGLHASKKCVKILGSFNPGLMQSQVRRGLPEPHVSGIMSCRTG